MATVAVNWLVSAAINPSLSYLKLMCRHPAFTKFKCSSASAFMQTPTHTHKHQFYSNPKMWPCDNNKPTRKLYSRLLCSDMFEPFLTAAERRFVGNIIDYHYHWWMFPLQNINQHQCLYYTDSTHNRTNISNRRNVHTFFLNINSLKSPRVY